MAEFKLTFSSPLAAVVIEMNKAAYNPTYLLATFRVLCLTSSRCHFRRFRSEEILPRKETVL
jgi:hypothetical protein